MATERSQNQAGFTLLETIVALVILSAVTVAFFNFLSTALNGAGRVEASSIAYDRRANALELATAINPMKLPSGSLNLGTYKIQWTSSALTKFQHNTGYPTGIGRFEVALYRMIFSFPDNPTIQPIEITKIGYKADNLPALPFGDDPTTTDGSGR